MSESIREIPVQKLHADASLPRYAHPGDGGMDLHAATMTALSPFERVLIPCGIALSIPDGYAGFVLPRSGLALKQGFSLVNSPGLIDSNYRGEIKVIAINLDPKADIIIQQGDRIAQLVIMKVEEASLVVCGSLEDSVRGEKGFGSSGL